MKTRSNLDDMSYVNYSFKSVLDKSLHTLEGILKGIAIDGKINKNEIAELSSWYNDYVGVSERRPFNELIPKIKEAIADGVLTPDEIEGILWSCKNHTTPNLYFDIITADIQRLHGIIHGILADNKIEEEELRQLQNWVNENFHLKGSYPYDEIDSIINAVLLDGKIDHKEHDFLKVFFSEFISLPTHSKIDQDELIRLKKSITIPGICAVCPEIEFDEKIFCFTGISSRAKRSEIAVKIEGRGGFYIDSVRKDLNYLIVGNFGNPCWAFSCYGRKVEQVITHRKNGINILIVNENDLWDVIA